MQEEKIAQPFDAEKAKKECVRDPSLRHGKFVILAEADELYPLIVTDAGSRLQAFTASAKDLELFWHEKYQQYYWRVKTTQEVSLNYLIKGNKEYETADLSEVKVNETSLLEDAKLAIRLQEYCRSCLELRFLFESTIKPATKIKKLRRFFFAGFKDEPLEGEYSSEDKIFAYLKQKRGACAVRSYLFTLLTHLVGIPTVYGSNGYHAYPELLCGSPPSYKRYDKLGGGDTYAGKHLEFTLAASLDFKNQDEILSAEDTFNTVKFDPVKKTISFLHDDAKDKPGKSTGEEKNLFELITKWRKLRSFDATAAIPKNCYELRESSWRESKTYGLPGELPHLCLLLAELQEKGFQARLNVTISPPRSIVELARYNQITNNYEWIDVNRLYPSPEAVRKQSVFAAYFEPKTITLVSDLIKSEDKLDLILLAAGQSASEADSAIIHALNEQKTPPPHLYINSAEELEDFCGKIEKDKAGDYKYIKGKGYLSEFVAQNDGVLVINWNNFTPEEMVRYKGIFFREIHSRSGLTIKINNGIKIVSLLNKNKQGNKILLGLSQTKVLSSEFFQIKPNAESVGSQGEMKPPLKINLFRSNYFWQDIIFGNYKRNDKGKLEFRKGALQNAMEKGVCIHIENPPVNNPEFELFCKRVNLEHQVVIDGELFKFPPGFTITSATKEFAFKGEMKVTADVKQVSDNTYILLKEASPKENIFYLNINNFEEFLEQQIIAADGTAQTAPGLLHNYKEPDDVIYISGSIPHDLWLWLNYAMTTKYPDKKFYFRLAPGAEIEGVYKSPKTPIISTREGLLQLAEKKVAEHVVASTSFVTLKLKQSQQGVLEGKKAATSQVYYSRDPMLLLEELQNLHKDEKLTTIFLTPETCYADLIAATKTPPVGSDKYALQKKELLERLKAGETVILYGGMSQELYQQLLPILDGNKFWFNGEFIELQGKLILALPENKAASLQLTAATKVDYTWKQYEDHLRADGFLAEEKKGSVEDFNHVKLYFTKVLKLKVPYAKSSLLTYARVKKCMHALSFRRRILHEQDPVKAAVLLPDFPKGSKQYPYLNVAGKIIFSDEKTIENTYVRLEKLKNIIHDSHVNINDLNSLRQHGWNLLNCFSAKVLKELFSSSGIKNEDIDFDALSDDVLKKLQAFLAANVKKEEAISSEAFVLTADKKAAGVETTGAVAATTSAKLWFPLTLPLTQQAGKALILEEKKEKTGVAKRKKQLEQLMTLLQEDECKAVLAQRPRGSGKTYLFQNIKDELLINGMVYPKLKTYFVADKSELAAKVKAWEDDKLGEPSVIIIDEFNTYPDGTWNYLLAKATKTRKIILPGNPVSTEGRDWQSMITDVGVEAIDIPLPNKDYYFKVLEQQNINNFNKIKPFIGQLIGVCNLLEKQALSLRSLISLATRFAAYEDHSKDTLFAASILEFAYGMKVKPVQDNFISGLKTLLGIEKVVALQRNKLEEIIINHLKARNEDVGYRRGLILEGDPLSGKTEFIKKLIIEEAKDYCEIKAFDHDADAKLREAAAKGQVVLIKDINIDTALWPVLNELLDPTNSKVTKGFFVVATQGVSEASRTIPEPIKDRMPTYYFGKRSREELEAKVESEHTSSLVDALLEADEKFGYSHAPETFFAKYKDYKESMEAEEEETVLPKSSHTI